MALCWRTMNTASWMLRPYRVRPVWTKALALGKMSSRDQRLCFRKASRAFFSGLTQAGTCGSPQQLQALACWSVA